MPLIGTVPPPRLKPGQDYRKLGARRLEDALGATVRATAMPWWKAVVDDLPHRSGAWWMWVVEVAKLP